jgi:GNAT superfamily N-acetyltransferase
VLTIRPARWPDDLALVDGLDTSYTTDRIYRVIRDESRFTLVEEQVDPPLRKEHGPVTGHEDGLTTMEYAAVAELDGVVAGFAAATVEAWNRRVLVRHLYVADGYRRSGVGTALVHDLDAFARSAGARCLWLDTPNVNYPAIQFYLRVGFHLCGLDESFYDPAGSARGEIGLFFVREIEGQ